MPGNRHDPLCIDDEIFAAIHGWNRRHLTQKRQIVKPEPRVPIDVLDALF